MSGIKKYLKCLQLKRQQPSAISQIKIRLLKVLRSEKADLKDQEMKTFLYFDLIINFHKLNSQICKIPTII